MQKRFVKLLVLALAMIAGSVGIFEADKLIGYSDSSNTIFAAAVHHAMTMAFGIALYAVFKWATGFRWATARRADCTQMHADK